MFTFSKKIALRYLWSKRSEAFISIISVISVLGVAIGVAVLNIVISVMTGFEHELRDKIINTNSHIVVKKLGDKVESWRDVQAQISIVPGVVSSSAFTYHQALIRSESGATGILVRGLEPGSASSKQLESYLEPGSKIEELFHPQAIAREEGGGETVLPGIVVGKELARSALLLSGTPLSLLSPQVGSTPFGLVPRFRRFVVSGIYSSGLVEYESGLAYVSLEEAQRFFRMGDAVSGFEVRVENIFESPKVAQLIMEKLGGVQSGFYAQDWTEVNKPLWDAMALEKRVYFLVLLLIIVMASFSIITTLIMIVLEKRKDIAILRTMGASTKAIERIFVILGTVIGAGGTLAGLLLGYLGCLALKTWGFPIDPRIFPVATLPVRMEPENFLIIGLISFLICRLATIYPSKRAAAMNPAEVLRYE